MSNERLKEAMVTAHIDIEAVARATGVDPKTVQRWLSGRVPYTRHRWKVAELLNQREDVLWPSVANKAVTGATLLMSQETTTSMNELEGTDLDMSRRLLLQGALGLVVEASIPTEVFLLQCASSIKACWHLLHSKGHLLASEMLATYMPTLMTLTFRPSNYQETAANLATQARILQAVLAMHRLDLTARELYCLEAVRCGRLAGDGGYSLLR